MSVQTQRMQIGTKRAIDHGVREWRPVRPPSSNPIRRENVGGGKLDESEYFWGQLCEADYKYLTERLVQPNRCPWCRSYYMHTAACVELRRSWQPVMPFGKYKGKPLGAVPVEYLEWLIVNVNLSPELLDAVQSRIAEAM